MYLFMQLFVIIINNFKVYYLQLKRFCHNCQDVSSSGKENVM